MATIHDLSWNEISFHSKFQLFLLSQREEGLKIRSQNRMVQAAGYSALASTYYSIAGTAVAQLREIRTLIWFLAPVRFVWWCLTWLPLGAWCYLRMLPLSNRVVDLIGYDQMSPELCDIRQSILRRRGRYEEAKRCIEAALNKTIEKPHTRGLLYVGSAQIYWRQGHRDKVIVNLGMALGNAVLAKDCEPLQTARIFRHIADLADSLGGFDLISADELRRLAHELVVQADAKDQLLKQGCP